MACCEGTDCFVFLSSQLLQFQKAGMFTVGTAVRPCAQVHYSLTEKHLRRVRIDTFKPTC